MKPHSENVRISVMIEKKIVDNLRTLQASMINDLKENVSFSQIANLALKEGVCKLNKEIPRSQT